MRRGRRRCGSWTKPNPCKPNRNAKSMQRFNGPFRKAKLALIEHVQLPELIVQFLSRRSKRQHNMIYQFLLVVSVLWLAPVAVDAANSFTYNDDVQCTYPFEQFQVQSITCAKPTYVQLGEGQGNNAKSEALCSFGDQMDLYGRITVSQAVTRDYYITLIACFRSGEASWYNSKHCGTYRVKGICSKPSRPTTMPTAPLNKSTLRSWQPEPTIGRLDC
jgi:hypothetical protein